MAVDASDDDDGDEDGGGETLVRSKDLLEDVADIGSGTTTIAAEVGESRDAGVGPSAEGEAAVNVNDGDANRLGTYDGSLTSTRGGRGPESITSRR